MSTRYDGSDDQDYDPADPFITTYHTWRESNRQYRQIEESLVKKYEELYIQFREKVRECEREKRNAILWEKHQRMAEIELNGLKSVVESSPFAFVVIDGDGAVFNEELTALGEEGGGLAAHELHKQLKEYFHSSPYFSGIDTIFVHVVLSVEGLSRALHASGILAGTDHGLLTKFGRGFCRAQPLFSFTDVGYGKEQADHKVRKLFEVMEKNVQCRCLILGGCHDNGYATFLESFRGNTKICLLETTPAAADFRKSGFKRFSLPDVFRSEPVPSRSQVLAAGPPGFAFSNGNNGLSATAKPAPAPSPRLPPPIDQPVQQQPTPVSAKLSDSSFSYASVGKTSSPLTINIAPQKKAAPKERPFYLLNKDDERVDVPLPKVDQAVVKRLEDRRNANGANFCNRYHLSNSCKNGNDCQFQHGERLSGAELLALRYKTRNLVCTTGHLCRDPSCNLGHHCNNPGSCFFGGACRFADFHGMDVNPTIKVYEDGAREIM
ncbi:hypothetical protein QBC35DRAFT_510266 [Podospora australis]|uniref:C3H1-type domain-containing protein n=1 Tax=Podospora australis TaxID=1536484 RepID=A0AAN6WI55_9PEZI|nr:hypothetical protein QBC35DRAFT_510266 [Podospora australis]